jgi:hypothetical protein
VDLSRRVELPETDSHAPAAADAIADADLD